MAGLTAFEALSTRPESLGKLRGFSSSGIVLELNFHVFGSNWSTIQP
jgi:hypothetical protein